MSSAVATLWPEDLDYADAWTDADGAAGSDRPKALIQYQLDPIGFFRDILGVPEHTIRWSLNPGYDQHRWDGTEDPLVAVVEAMVRWENVGIESATGTGKSFLLALIYLWFLGCWDGARVFSFAPKENQLRQYSWMEVDKLWPRFKRYFPAAEKNDLRIRMIPGSDEWGAIGWPVAVRVGEEVSSRAAGMHAPHMLLVYEEAQGVAPSVLNAGHQTCTAPHNLQIAVGNPDHQFDGLHQHCEREDVTDVRISALDYPNVVADDSEIVPGAVSRKSVQSRTSRFGVGSRLYNSRIRGISPPEAQDALVRKVWVDAAVARYHDPRFREGLPARGVDVADKDGGDEAAIARGLGACVLEVVSFPVGDSHDCKDASQLGVMVALEMRLESIDETHVGVDAVGNGASTVNKLRELGKLIQGLNGGAGALPTIDEDLLRDKGKGLIEEELYRNFRAQMHYQLRLDLQHGRIALPNDPELIRDLLITTWRTNLGKIEVTEKEKIKADLGRSPNKADAVVYWNWVRHRRAMPVEEKQLGAWSPEMLRAEFEAGRRIKPRPEVRPGNVPITSLEHIP